MLKLKVVAKDGGVDFHGRKVDDVTEYERTSCYGSYKAWVGSTEKEYFSMMFMYGFLTISIEERECNLNYNITKYAVSNDIFKTLNVGDDLKMNEMVLEYNKSQALTDLKDITFDDVMESLDWKFKRGTTLKKDLFYS